MSENLSVDEIIKKAEKIKAEAERQLAAAEKSLDEKAKNAINEVTVDEEKVARRIAQTVEKQDDDVKEYIPASKSGKPGQSEFKTKVINIGENSAKSKTKKIQLSDDDMKIADNSFEPFEKKQEQPQRVAFVSKAGKDEKTDLEKIPTIVARDEVFNDKENLKEEIGVQITFDGFDDKIESVPTIDEEVAEQILEQRRREKVGKFRLFGPDETDKRLGQSEVSGIDYLKKSEKDRFFEGLNGKRVSVKKRLIVTLVLAVFVFCLTFLYDTEFFPVFLSPPGKAYFITNLVVFAAVIAANFNVIIHGFNLKKGLNSDFPVSVGSLVIAAHTAAMTGVDDLWYENRMIFTIVGTLMLLFSQLGKYKMLCRICDNFKYISSEGDKYTVENISNSVDSEIIAREFLPSDSSLEVSVKADFPTNFLEIECKKEPADKISVLIFAVMTLLSVVLGVTVYLKNGQAAGINTALSAFCISLPASCAFLTNLMLYDVNTSLDYYSAAVCGYEGALMADSADAIVMEAADLFGKNCCDIHGIKTFNGTKVDDAIIYAAAVMTKTKSPLAAAFDGVIIGKQSILPKVEDVTYEDKMGTSAWIYKRKVLVGNRQLLERHGIKCPKESYEKRFTVKDRKLLYLAVGGKISAMFVVSYSANADLKAQLKKLEKSSVTIIVKSCDPYINEESIAQLFDLPADFIRVMDSSAARVYEKYSGIEVEKSPAYIVHNGTALAYISAVCGAKTIIAAKKIISFALTFGSAVGFATVALLSVLGAFSQISVPAVIIFQIVWSAFCAVITKFRTYTV